jgi:hypothetical protein
MAMTDLQWIRYKLPGGVTDIADAVVLAFLDEYTDRPTESARKLALADCYEYAARNVTYQSQSRGGISYGASRLLADAARLRGEVGATIDDSARLTNDAYTEEAL